MSEIKALNIADVMDVILDDERELPGLVLDRLVSNRRRPASEQLLGEGALDPREVIVCEDDLPGEIPILAFQGLFDLEHELGIPSRFRRNEGRPDRAVVSVTKAGAGTSAGFHPNLVTRPDERLRASRRERHPILPHLDLFQHADFHRLDLLTDPGPSHAMRLSASTNIAQR